METERDPRGDPPPVSAATTPSVRVHTLSLWSRGGRARPAPPDRPADIPDVVFASDDRWHRNGPLLLVLLAVAFNLWAFRAEARTVEYGNDMVLHTQMVTLAHHLISLGRIPLGQWYPFMAQGSSLFVQYQSFSAILTGAVSSVIGVRLAMSLSLYLLFSLWPISVYFSGRLLGFGRWVAGVAAVMAPLLWSINIRGFEIRAYAWNGAGLWSQLWAMWTLPLAWGFCWRYVSQRRYLAGAVITLALTIAFHFITAYLAVLALVILVVVSPRQLAARLRRAAVVGVGAVLASIWILVPFFADVRWTSVDGAELGTTVVNSYGAPTVLKWLVTGNLYDHGRVPIITFFVAVGLVVCLRRWRVDERARVVVGLWVLSLLLFFGRPTLGPLLNVLPDSGRLLLQRYVSGVQLAGLFMAGVGALTVARWIAASIEARVRRRGLSPDATRRYERLRIPLAGIALLAALTPAFVELTSFGSQDAREIAYQRGQDQTAGAQLNVLVSYIARHGGGRTYAGLDSNWGLGFTVGAVPVFQWLAEDGVVDPVGFGLWSSSLMMNSETSFDETNPGDFQAFDVHYLLLPAGHTPPVPATFIESRGTYTLWTYAPPSIVQVIDTQGTISANSTTIGAQTTAFLHSASPGLGVYPTIAFDGRPAATPTLAAGATATGPAGSVSHVRNSLVTGTVTADVDATRQAVVLLKSTFDPGWTVTVDGHAATTVMLAPAFVGVEVTPGRHVVTFAFRGFRYYPLLYAISALAIAAVVIGEERLRRWTRRLRRRESAESTA